MIEMFGSRLGSDLSDNKLLLLAIGINRGGILYAEEFDKVYSSSEAALSAIHSLRAWGYIRLYSRDSTGIFRVVLDKVPHESWEIARNLKSEQDSLKGQ